MEYENSEVEACREFGIDYVEKAAFATSVSLFSVIFGRIVQRFGEEHNKYLVDQMLVFIS